MHYILLFTPHAHFLEKVVMEMLEDPHIININYNELRKKIESKTKNGRKNHAVN